MQDLCESNGAPLNEAQSDRISILGRIPRNFRLIRSKKGQLVTIYLGYIDSHELNLGTLLAGLIANNG